MPTPEELVAQRRPGGTVVGWKLDRAQRSELLGRFPPAYGNIVADHVTLAAKVSADTPLPDRAPAEAVGRIDDGKGVEAIVVAIGGSTDRPGGGTYHITWSLGPGRRARESNDTLAAGPWQPLAQPIALALEPARF
ncbi:hypothetical protein GRI75_04470 [Altererythrobacter soli]|uniref:Uncharacterized protein n=1 Tax=Croceibacterium soli TaxID=1739690 RepID=A0A6I4UT76_9SPHN|nr:hypothetical protein [Croceibacterium soli]MXP40899.1 hypothetical protein [Croceibacterium soli]